jgi:C4-type Zn-finger protein
MPYAKFLACSQVICSHCSYASSVFIVTSPSGSSGPWP